MTIKRIEIASTKYVVQFEVNLVNGQSYSEMQTFEVHNETALKTAVRVWANKKYVRVRSVEILTYNEYKPASKTAH